jgi:hypothetical protein
VVAVDLDVAARVDLEIEQAVAGDLLEHVAQERQRRLNAALPSAIQVNANADGRLGRLAFYGANSLWH